MEAFWPLTTALTDQFKVDEKLTFWPAHWRSSRKRVQKRATISCKSICWIAFANQFLWRFQHNPRAVPIRPVLHPIRNSWKSPMNLSKYKFLIADDHFLLRQMMSRALKEVAVTEIEWATD